MSLFGLLFTLFLFHSTTMQLQRARKTVSKTTYNLYSEKNLNSF